MTRRNVGIGLVVTALVLAVAAFVLWQNGTDDAKADQLAEEFRASFDGGPAEDVDPDRAGPIALGAVAGVLFLGGVIVLVSPSRDS